MRIRFQIFSLLFAFILLLTCTALFGMAKTSTTEPMAGGPASPAADLVWIAKADEATSCNAGSGIDIDSMGHSLIQSGVKILQKKKFHDNKMHILSCGADKGALNGYLISKKELPRALALGFKEVQ